MDLNELRDDVLLDYLSYVRYVMITVDATVKCPIVLVTAGNLMLRRVVLC